MHLSFKLINFHLMATFFKAVVSRKLVYNAYFDSTLRYILCFYRKMENAIKFLLSEYKGLKNFMHLRIKWPCKCVRSQPILNLERVKLHAVIALGDRVLNFNDNFKTTERNRHLKIIIT